MQTIARRPRGRPKAELVVSAEQRAALERWARRPKTTQALALRARIVLRRAGGLSNEVVASELAVHAATVGKWRRRFFATRGCNPLVETPPPYRDEADDSSLKNGQSTSGTTERKAG